MDTSGAERYTTHIKDLSTGEKLDEAIENTRGDAVWAADNQQFFYLVVNDNWRSHQVRVHVLGDHPDNDRVVYEEADDGFSVDVSQSSSRSYIIVSTGDQVTTEQYLIDSNKPQGDPKLVLARRENHEYEVDEQGDHFVIRTNDQHENFRLATAPLDDLSHSRWTTLIEGTSNRYLRGFKCFEKWIALSERVEGIDQICVIDRAGHSTYINFPESVYSASLGSNPEYSSELIRVVYASMVSPTTVYDFDPESRSLTTRKVQEIPSGYDKSVYQTYRVEVPARDGAKVPVSIMHRKDVPLDGSAPLYLYGYGAYGIAIPPSFSTSRLSLVDRGFIYAIAHIRGGSELGHDWYEQGKLKSRTNTFNVDATPAPSQ